MRYIEVSDSSSLETALKRVDGHGHIHLTPGNYSQPILITRPVKLTGAPSMVITGNVTVKMGVKTVSIEGISFENSKLSIDSARDVHVNNCRFKFTDTAINISGVNISVTGCEFIQTNSHSSYSAIVVSGCSNLEIVSNTHVKQEASLHSFIRLLPKIYSGLVRIHSNVVDGGDSSSGSFVHASLVRCGTRKVRFSLVDNTFISNKSSSGGFFIIESKNPDLFSGVLDYDDPSEISKNSIVNPYLGWVFLDVVGEPMPQKIYFVVDDNKYTGVYNIKPLCHLVNDTVMLSNSLERNLSSWENVAISKNTIHVKTSAEGESFITIFGAVGFAILIVIITIAYTRSLKK